MAAKANGKNGASSTNGRHPAAKASGKKIRVAVKTGEKIDG